ncbi:hypothetical protein [Aeromonas sp. BIGb0445]|uniref:hypothetical protein n=1 Tax=Aeromonas sp. BIGb0445 TaxID=2940593 RepID=UPI0021696F76|nr:hypothetical protein [Aeromonas sp. BIGb0445]MCS3460167.1 hypothetical protein [Aeromonas sp. BIGb0445]
MKNKLYCVTDKALNDALNQSRITTSELGELFLDRGIIISKLTKREHLARNYSKFNHDYYDHQKIASFLGSTARRERVTSKKIDNDIAKHDLLEAAERLKSHIENDGDLCQVYASDKNVYIDITYLSMDYGKSEFKQVIKKTAKIEIEKKNTALLIRRPDNEQVESYEQELLHQIERLITHVNDDSINENNGETLNIKEISLEDVDAPNLRTLFFTKLIDNLNGFILDDVTDAYVYHPKPEKVEEEEGDVETGIHVSRASLKGEGILKSEELSSLYDRGFYIWRVRWHSKENSPDPDIYEFEAQFSNQSDFRGFSYAVKGVKKYKGNGEYNKNFVSLPRADENRLCNIIENAAYSVITIINELAQGNEEHG